MNLTEAIGRVVRGEDRWESLRERGIQIDHSNDEWSISFVESGPVPIEVHDLAFGFLNLSSGNEPAEWASFILAASPLIDLESLQNYPHGEILLNGLWNLSFGEKVGKDVMDVAMGIVTDRQKKKTHTAGRAEPTNLCSEKNPEK